MRMHKNISLGLAGLALIMTLAGWPAAAAPAGFPRRPTTSPTTCVSMTPSRWPAAPTAEAITSLKARGVQDDRQPEARLGTGNGRRAAAIAAQGLRYVHVPVSPETFSLADVEDRREGAEDEDAAPILFHCAQLEPRRRGDGRHQGAEGSLSRGGPRRRVAGFGLKSEAMVAAMKRVAAEVMAGQPR